MKLHYDWRLARVVDDEGVIHDELAWSSKRSAGAVADRLWDLQRGRLSPEARTLSDRFPEAIIDPLGVMSDDDWPELDDEESKLFETATPILAREGLQMLLAIQTADWICLSPQRLNFAPLGLQARHVVWNGLVSSSRK